METCQTLQAAAVFWTAVITSGGTFNSCQFSTIWRTFPDSRLYWFYQLEKFYLNLHFIICLSHINCHKEMEGRRDLIYITTLATGCYRCNEVIGQYLLPNSPLTLTLLITFNLTLNGNCPSVPFPVDVFQQIFTLCRAAAEVIFLLVFSITSKHTTGTKRCSLKPRHWFTGCN